MDDFFVIVRKRKNYAQNTINPKISTDEETYKRLADVSAESGQTISEIARQAIAYALDRMKYADE